MARSKSTLEVIPSARRLIRSLRDVGYDFKHAVADLIDNSVAAGASSVAIDMRFDGKDSFLRIADNGVGMNGTTITEAMRFGTERDYEADELGKFGLGLKTASLSQCSRLTVASRFDRAVKRIETRQWDLAHVETSNRWEIIDLPTDERPDALVEPLYGATGTVVLWEVMDRVLGYKIPWGDRARNGFLRLADELDQHLGMVFHRFLTGEARRRKKLRITLNGTKVEAWDPFARDEKATIRFPTKQLEIHGDDGPGLVAYTAHILPAQERFSSLKAFNRYAGPGKWNYQQGFYIYRADRMIQSGGWSYMRTSDEHTKLARAALDFWPDLDSAFDLNVAKARVNLPAQLKEQLRPHVEQLAKQARKVYSPLPNTLPGHTNRPQDGISCESSELRPGVKPLVQYSSGYPSTPSDGGQVSAKVTLVQVGRAIDSAAAKAGENAALKRIKKALNSKSPETARTLGW
ncbi:MAG: ATP-binding protein [Steroidobacteraceae bacterium]